MQLQEQSVRRVQDVQDYLNNGGKIQVLPEWTTEEEPATIQPKAHNKFYSTWYNEQ